LPVRLPVVQDYVFGNPQVTGSDHAPDFETFPTWLQAAGGLDIASAADPLARLGIFQHGVFSVDLVFQFEIVRVGGCPVLVQCGPDIPICHTSLPALAISSADARVWGYLYRPTDWNCKVAIPARAQSSSCSVDCDPATPQTLRICEV
jgi:hypothetical protein